MNVFWDNKFKGIKAVGSVSDLPDYGFSFFFKNIGPFKKSFTTLTAVRVASTVAGFLATYIISEILTQISDISVTDVFYKYLPLYITAKLLAEIFDFFTRKYSEAFPQMFLDHIKLRFYKSLISSRSPSIFNYSKERLGYIVDKYISGSIEFLGGWVWGTPQHITTLLIIIIILFRQSPAILLVNVVMFSIFMILSYRLSKKYAITERVYTDRLVKNDPVMQSFFLNLNSVIRLNIPNFFSNTYIENRTQNWKALRAVRDIHANRWVLQLSIYDTIYAGTFFYGVYQVVTNQLSLGFLILIKWSYDNLWHFMVHFIEMFVQLVKQKQNSIIAKNELEKILIVPKESKKAFPKKWKEIVLKDVWMSFENKKDKQLKIKVPDLTIKRGQKIGIVGESGSGKSTLLMTLLNFINYAGDISVDGKDLKLLNIRPQNITYISNEEPLFNISLENNIILGKKVDNQKLKYLMDNLQVSKFFSNLQVKVGDKDINFSSGQLQRLRLLRGLATDSQIYLLDEPFNGIDKENKDSIIKFVKAYLKDKTIILVTHHESELSIVDTKFIFKNSVLSKI